MALCALIFVVITLTDISVCEILAQKKAIVNNNYIDLK